MVVSAPRRGRGASGAGAQPRPNLRLGAFTTTPPSSIEEEGFRDAIGHRPALSALAGEPGALQTIADIFGDVDSRLQGGAMQFIESSILGVRSARLTFASPREGARVTLFPMAHIGEPEFYRTTYEDALTHDVVLWEGVSSPITRRITRSYRWLLGSRAMAGLVLQPRLPTDTGKARLVHADLTTEEFEREWKAIPLWMRVAVDVLAPLLGLQRRWFSSRSKLAEDMRCEDQPSLAELLAFTPETGALTQAILHARDQRLLERLRAELDLPEPHTIAVVYGAAHMRAVVKDLTTKRQFSVIDGEWRVLLADVR